jgi:hypothetical protein
MKEVKLGEKKALVPEKWEEIKFSKFLEFMNLTKSFKTPKEIEEMDLEDDMREFHITLENLKVNTKMVSFWTGVSEDELAMCDVDEVGLAIKDLSFLSTPYSPIRIENFVFEGEKYFLPKPDMSKQTFGTYVEAEQVEMNNAKLKKGKIEVLPEQIAILCKKEGETHIDDDEVDKRAEHFRGLDMATIWDVGFFLTRLESLLMISFLTLTKEQLTHKQELQQKEQ